MTVRINGALAEVAFAAPFDLERYRLFLRAKQLPESQLEYDWRSDTYRLTTPARFAALLGASEASLNTQGLPLADHLFDYQRFVVEQALAAKRFACWCDTGLGKALPIDTLVLTPYGSKPIGEVKVGDHLIGVNGRITEVKGVFPQGVRAAFRVTFSDGVRVVCDDEHLWAVQSKVRRHRGGGYRVIPLRQIRAEGLTDNGGARHFIPVAQPIRFRGKRKLPLHPYLLGLLLGDGGLSTTWPHFTTADPELLESVRELVPAGTVIKPRGKYGWALAGRVEGHKSGPVREALLSLDLMGHRSESKFIPEVYKFARIEDRIALLQGLLDTDGHVRKDQNVEYLSVSRQLAEDVAWLIRSVGGTAAIREKRTTGQLAYRMSVRLPEGISPFRLERKQQVYFGHLQYRPVRSIASVEPCGEAEMVCIKVSAPDGLFVLANTVVTHNTAIELEYARQVQAITSGKVLIVTPLQVIPQMIEMARGWYGHDDCDLYFDRLTTRQELEQWCEAPSYGRIGITNPEKFIDGIVSQLRLLAGLVVDESSLLKTGGGVIKWNLIKSARGIEYKLSATATPAPNDRMEYASQASFLEKLRSEGEVIWTYFQKTKTGDWIVKPRARDAFYRFMASWSIYLRDPARFGFADILSTLPEPDIREYKLPITDLQRELMYGFVGQKGGLFSDDRLGVKERSKLSQLAKGFHYETRNGKRLVARVDSHKPAFVADLIRADVAEGRQVLAWTVFDEESVILSQELGRDNFEVAVLDGSMALEQRADILERFRRGQVTVLISKAQLLGYGLNLQFCRSMVFSGFDDSFERMYQAIRRCYRFGQTETVRVHIPYVPELEGMVYSNVRRKQQQFEEDAAAAELAYRDAFRFLLPGETVAA